MKTSSFMGLSPEYVAEQLKAGLEGYKKMKAACAASADTNEVFGNLNIKIYEDMIAEEKLKEKNQGGQE